MLLLQNLIETVPLVFLFKFKCLGDFLYVKLRKYLVNKIRIRSKLLYVGSLKIEIIPQLTLPRLRNL